MDDYEPHWDYEIDEEPDELVAGAVEEALKVIQDVSGKMGLGNIRVAFIHDQDDAVARYINGTYENPYFVIHAPVIAAYVREAAVGEGARGLEAYRAIEVTLVHELGHAYLESMGIPTMDHDEDVVEGFAREFCDYRSFRDSIPILDEFAEDYLNALQRGESDHGA